MVMGVLDSPLGYNKLEVKFHQNQLDPCARILNKSWERCWLDVHQDRDPVQGAGVHCTRDQKSAFMRRKLIVFTNIATGLRQIGQFEGQWAI
jgi:hypothetical protein